MTIPIVMGNHDPVEQGLIASFAHPGGNITGWSFLSVDLGEKQLVAEAFLLCVLEPLYHCFLRWEHTRQVEE